MVHSHLWFIIQELKLWKMGTEPILEPFSLRNSLCNYARFLRTVCMCRIRWSCEGLMSVHNEYTGYTLKYLLLRLMYNLSLPNLCATCSSLVTLRLPTVDPYSAEVPGGMHPQRVTGGEFFTLYCVVAYIAACVDASRTVFWDRSITLAFSEISSGNSSHVINCRCERSKIASLIILQSQVAEINHGYSVNVKSRYWTIGGSHWGSQGVGSDELRKSTRQLSFVP